MGNCFFVFLRASSNVTSEIVFFVFFIFLEGVLIWVLLPFFKGRIGLFLGVLRVESVVTR